MTNEDIREIMELVAALKIILLADEGWDGGLSETSRKRAWGLARDAGFILLRAGVDQENAK
jgi:hypothetical protein